MPARPFVANVLKIAFAGTVGPYAWGIITHCSWSGTTPTATILNALAADIHTAWGASYKPEIASSCVLSSITLTDLTSALGAQGLVSPNEAGTNAGVCTAGNTSVLVTYPSSIRYRGGHPRTYLLPPIASQLLDDGHITTAFAGNIATAWNAVLATYYGSSSGGTTLAGQVAVSYVTALAPRVTPLVMPIAQNSITVHQQLASQRRRIGRK